MGLVVGNSLNLGQSGQLLRINSEYLRVGDFERSARELNSRKRAYFDSLDFGVGSSPTRTEKTDLSLVTSTIIAPELRVRSSWGVLIIIDSRVLGVGVKRR